MEDTTALPNAVELATELTIAWLGNPNTRASSDEVPAFLSRMHEAVLGLGNTASDIRSEASEQEFTPATTVRRSLASKDHIISLIDGKPYKTLRRHLGTHGLTPEQYRERYKLKADYPMIAPNYSEARRAMAKTIGLGQRSRPAKSAPAPEPQPGEGPTRRSPQLKPAGSAPTGAAPKRRGPKPKVAPGPAPTE